MTIGHAPPLTASTIAAKLFRGFADPTRLAILLALTEGERRVTDLVGQLGAAQSTVSGHLACLKDCGLVTDRPQGRAVYYRVASPEVYELLVAAERLLAITGTAIDLCPNYRSRDATPTPTKEPA
jgi:DNA-binding transcriptional ArsR family regulator